MPENLTPFERAVEVVKSPEVCPWLNLKQEQALINAVTTALQAQSNADELRHREKQAALRTLLAGQAKRADEQLGNAFVEGAKWWEWRKTQATMWPSDVTFAEEEAARRGFNFKPSFEKWLEAKLANAEAEREAAEKRADEAEARLHEGDFVDEFGTTWTRPTGWAYRQVCRDAEAAQAEVERAHGPHFVPGIQAMARVNAKFREERDNEKARADNAVAVMDAALAHAAELRRALERQRNLLSSVLTGGAVKVELQDEIAVIDAAIALSPGEALERVRREAKAEVWEAIARNCEARSLWWEMTQDPALARGYAAELRKGGE